jgi:protein-S-isoprenylcysteine O-methyltransferase Ste14
MKIRHTAAIYFALQGIAVVAWWFLLIFVPASRKYFQLESNSETSLLAFWLADLSLLGIGSLLTAWLCFHNSRHAPTASWFVCGAISYAALYCLAFALFTDSGWLGVTLMLPAMIWSGNYSIALSPVSDVMFRQAKTSSTNWILLKTFVQIFVVWSLVLVVFPYLITILEDKLGVPRVSFPFQKIIGAIFFVGISFIGLASAYTMSKVGKGTPLPLDSAANLVVSGTYKYVRNPMAVSGIGQGLAVALFLGSPLVAIYAVMGALVWQFIFRPLEEADLRKRFGADYENYCSQVRCWIPNRQPYQSESTALSSNSIESPSGKI